MMALNELISECGLGQSLLWLMRAGVLKCWHHHHRNLQVLDSLREEWRKRRLADVGVRKSVQRIQYILEQFCWQRGD